MLQITVPGIELFDESNNEFISHDPIVLELEHSLASVSKWESIFEKPFLSQDEKTTEEVFGYIKAMTMTPNVPEGTYSRLSQANIDEINAYIEAKMTATRFFDPPGGSSKPSETVTAELVYYWMVSFQIPFEAQHWHLNQLLTLIRVCSVKNSKPKKMGRAEAAQRQRELNAQRKAALGTKG
jgi:hypothetical protein